MTHPLLNEVKNKFSKSIEKNFRAGDTVKVHYKVKEGDKERIQVFEGVVIAMKAATFTVRKISHEVGVERILPFNSPFIEKVEVIKRGKVRRAKLYYLRDKVGKSARIKELKAK